MSLLNGGGYQWSCLNFEIGWVFLGATSAHHNNNNNKFEPHQPYTPGILVLYRDAMLVIDITPMISSQGGIVHSFMACDGGVITPHVNFLGCSGLI